MDLAWPRQARPSGLISSGAVIDLGLLALTELDRFSLPADDVARLAGALSAPAS